MPHRLHTRPARKHTPISRNRVLYDGLALTVIATGLLWKTGLIPLPQWLSNNGGGALWALMVFIGFGSLLSRATTSVVALLALAFSWGAEFLQLYHAPWIEAARATIPGRLVPGNTFNWPDLSAYLVGIVLGALAEWWWRARPSC